MKMTAFRVENYRCVLDSGWVDIDDIAVIVGKNESGKTSILKALWKFNPFKPEPYNLDREWPRGKRKDRSVDKTIVAVRFGITPEEQKILGEIDDSTKGITDVEIKRNYKGTYTYNFLPNNPDHTHNLKWVISVIEEHFGRVPENSSKHFKTQYKTALDSFVKLVRDNGGSEYAIKEAPAFKSRLTSFRSTNTSEHPQDNQAIQQLQTSIDKAISELSVDPPLQRAIDTIHEWLPTFIYMDDYKIFSGSAQLNHIKDRKDNNQLTDEDRTIILIMEMAGLNLDDEVKKGNQDDREQRILDMNDASQTLTDEIANRWTQKKYEIMFQADGQHFITFVKDIDSKVLVPLEERSKGFQWFFSFDMTFMYETKGIFENAIILLDEPGLHLHAAAQKDLLARMKEYAKNNQLIYTTHLPFMIDFTRLDNIYITEESEREGTKIHNNWATADKDARFTLQAALGLSWSQSLFVGQYNLVVEGITDFWFLTAFSAILQDAGQEGIDEHLVITPAGGASKVAYVGTILHGQNLNVAVLLDSDQEGKSAYEQLVHQWIINDKHVLMLGNILGVKHFCTLEDLFSEDYYLEHVNAAYCLELGNKNLGIGKENNKPIVVRVEEALKAQGIDFFNKGRVAKRIMQDLSKKKLSDLPNDTIDNFSKTIVAINKIIKEWKAK
jgi:predicted ATP-dependent endonuclease of OLD family